MDLNFIKFQWNWFLFALSTSELHRPVKTWESALLSASIAILKKKSVNRDFIFHILRWKDRWKAYHDKWNICVCLCLGHQMHFLKWLSSIFKKKGFLSFHSPLGIFLEKKPPANAVLYQICAVWGWRGRTGTNWANIRSEKAQRKWT